jgi:hypothetical protein
MNWIDALIDSLHALVLFVVAVTFLRSSHFQVVREVFGLVDMSQLTQLTKGITISILAAAMAMMTEAITHVWKASEPIHALIGGPILILQLWGVSMMYMAAPHGR